MYQSPLTAIIYTSPNICIITVDSKKFNRRKALKVGQLKLWGIFIAVPHKIPGFEGDAEQPTHGKRCQS